MSKPYQKKEGDCEYCYLDGYRITVDIIKKEISIYCFFSLKDINKILIDNVVEIFTKSFDYVPTLSDVSNVSTELQDFVAQKKEEYSGYIIE